MIGQDPQIQQLYEDIVHAGSSKQGQYHFIGAITCVTLGKSITEDVNTFQLIDGQQRVTSVMLLLRALKDMCGEKTALKESGVKRFLFNVEEDPNGKHYYKMKLFDEDDRSFMEIMENGHTINKGNDNIEANFKYFKTRLKKNDPEHVLSGIKRLSVVFIELEEKDNPQAIFESMNSTGLDLTPTDMIQNYMLMNSNPDWQQKIYKEYWHPMELKLNEFGGGTFDEFLRDYIIMKLEMFVSEKNVYSKFKEYMKDIGSKDEEIKEIYKFSEYYAEIIGPQNKFRDIQKEMQNIRKQGTGVANSLLLKILADKESGIRSAEDTKTVLQLLDSYLLRSYVAGTIKGVNKTLPTRISKIDSIVEWLVKHGNYPSDAKFKDNLERVPLYRNKAVCKYILGRLEQGADRIGIDLDSLEIEHIMPQNPSKEWIDDLGDEWREVYEKYIHAIGNLTLTESNQDMSNSRFSDKRHVYSTSRIKMTNKLSKHEEWGEQEIKDRAKHLIDGAVRMWPYPKGYDQSVSENDYTESEYLGNTNVIDMWHVLKKKILEAFPKMRFHMTSVYGAFTISAGGKRKTVCSIEARKNKIYLTYNVKIKDEVITPSGFMQDVSQVGHYSLGDLRSVIHYEEEFDEVLSIVRTAYDFKLQN